MVYAIVRAGGRQEKVSVGDYVTLNRVPGGAGSTLELPALRARSGIRRVEQGTLVAVIHDDGADVASRGRHDDHKRSRTRWNGTVPKGGRLSSVGSNRR